MKKRLPPFAAGMLTAALVGGLGLSALAASGQMTITVDPINIQVNGQTFQPKDATGADVPVFAYNGTTYAPLRALAEAYGLEVGYDAGANMATVTGDVAAPANTTTPAPDTTASAADYSGWSAEEEAAYQEFKGMWEIEGPEFNTDADGVRWAGYIAYCQLGDNRTKESVALYHSKHPNFIQRLVLEFRKDEDNTLMQFFGIDGDGNNIGAVLPIWTIRS